MSTKKLDFKLKLKVGL